MDEALDEIEFLALSANRVAVLRALADRPHTRSELVASTNASQPTLGRILRDFRDRRWTERTSEGYVATATGELVAEGIGELLVTIETDRTLRPIIDWLPTAAMDFDLRHLREATITAPSRTRPDAPLRRALDLLDEATSVRICSHTFNERSLTTVRDRVVEGNGTFAGVFSRAAIDALVADPTLRVRLGELLAASGATIRVYENGEIPVAVAITDDRVHLMLRDDAGILEATVDSDDPVVLSWAAATHERYWADATALDPGALGDE
jgi:predicted transcriptional regulator